MRSPRIVWSAVTHRRGGWWMWAVTVCTFRFEATVRQRWCLTPVYPVLPTIGQALPPTLPSSHRWSRAIAPDTVGAMLTRTKSSRAIYDELAGQWNWLEVRRELRHQGDLPLVVVTTQPGSTPLVGILPSAAPNGVVRRRRCPASHERADWCSPKPPNTTFNFTGQKRSPPQRVNWWGSCGPLTPPDQLNDPPAWPARWKGL